MLTQVVMNSFQQDGAQAVALPPPPTPQTDADSAGLTRFVEGVQGSLENMTVPLGVLLDPTRRRALTTAEMLWLQASVSDYSVTILTLSHIAQSVGSTVQSLTQRS